MRLWGYGQDEENKNENAEDDNNVADDNADCFGFDDGHDEDEDEGVNCVGEDDEFDLSDEYLIYNENTVEDDKEDDGLGEDTYQDPNENEDVDKTNQTN